MESRQSRNTGLTIQARPRVKKGLVIRGKITIVHDNGRSGPGKSASAQVYSETELDPRTGRGKLSEKARFKGGKSTKTNDSKTTAYKIKLHAEPEFGIPGALVIGNHSKHKFFLQSASLQTSDGRIIHFDCNSWIYPVEKTTTPRIFFSNSSYLPSQTPRGLAELRQAELMEVRGEGTGERKEWERIYDYDCYNDLGSPDRGPEHERRILGGSRARPYPRRGRTGRPPSKSDPQTESRPERLGDIYVPPDERLSSRRLSELISNSVEAALHHLIPAPKFLLKDSDSFTSFDELNTLFSGEKSRDVEEWIQRKLATIVPDFFLSEITRNRREENRSFRFPLPATITGNDWSWKDDEEFGRQMLAGPNPTQIRLLETFPLYSEYEIPSRIRRGHLECNLDGLTLDQAMEQRRIFILDHHDYLMPFLSRINTNGVAVYASRTWFFLRSDETLKPIAIELSLPEGSFRLCEASRLHLPPTEGYEEAALWQLAKAHVATNDAVYHQLISHWLHTHAVIEPFVIATRRQLSAMHPVHRLLHPHFKDTMHINALSREILFSSGGILEKTLFSGEVSMDLSSALYKKWKFKEQGLPADLLNRSMAVRDYPTGVKLIFRDYPYAVDGLEIWTAIKMWVEDFCSLFYKDDTSVTSDAEIQAWWSEIRNVGHGDKSGDTWREMTTLSDLTEALTTLIWIASARHASVNFGQYDYAGNPLNRPALCRKFLPEEGTFEYAEFLRDPERYFLRVLPDKTEMSVGIALANVLSRHTSDEVYLGQTPPWVGDSEIERIFGKFNKQLREIEQRIMNRNNNPRLKNRRGPAKIPYMLMFPDTSRVETQGGGGITGRGIPNSISI